MNTALWLAAVSGGAGPAPAFNPATLNLTLWNRAAYAGAPWAGVASAGASGSRSLANGSTVPTVGATLNGLATADFATNRSLTDTTLTLDNYLSATSYWVKLLVNLRNASAPAAGIYDNKTLVGENGGNWGVVYSTSGVACFHNDGAYKATPWAACATSAWAEIDVALSSGTLSIAVNGGTAQTVGVGALSSIGSLIPRIGRNYGSGYGDFLLADIMLAQSVPSSADRASVRTSYYASRYALSL